MGVTEREKEKRLRARIEESIIKSDWREGTASLNSCQFGLDHYRGLDSIVLEDSFEPQGTNQLPNICNSDDVNYSSNISISILSGVQTLCSECKRARTEGANQRL